MAWVQGNGSRVLTVPGPLSHTADEIDEGDNQWLKEKVGNNVTMIRDIPKIRSQCALVIPDRGRASHMTRAMKFLMLSVIMKFLMLSAIAWRQIVRIFEDRGEFENLPGGNTDNHESFHMPALQIPDRDTIHRMLAQLKDFLNQINKHTFKLLQLDDGSFEDIFNAHRANGFWTLMVLQPRIAHTALDKAAILFPTTASTPLKLFRIRVLVTNCSNLNPMAPADEALTMRVVYRLQTFSYEITKTHPTPAEWAQINIDHGEFFEDEEPTTAEPPARRPRTMPPADRPPPSAQEAANAGPAAQAPAPPPEQPPAEEPPKLIAIISHDAMKPTLARFARTYLPLLRPFRITGTGTTTALLGELGVVTEDFNVPSGPLGGDAHIARMISQSSERHDKVHALIFLQDSMTPHPHDADINALGRLCNVWQIPYATNYCTAVAVLEHVYRKHGPPGLVREELSTDDLATQVQASYRLGRSQAVATAQSSTAVFSP
jgi:methylglyoxal synthase